MKTCRLRHQGLDETKRVEMEGELANELKEDGRLTFTEFLWKDSKWRQERKEEW